MAASRTYDKEYYRRLFAYTIQLRERFLSRDEAIELVIAQAQKTCTDPYGVPVRQVMGTFNKAWDSDRQHFYQTDLGNGERLISLYGEDIRYCHDEGVWYVWDGKRWKRDSTKERIRSKAKAAARLMRSEADRMPEGDEKEALYKHWKSSETYSKLEAMINSATVEDPVRSRIGIQSSDLDTNKWLLNCENGTIDLQTGYVWTHSRLRIHSGDLITRLAPVRYDPDARCPTWERFLRKITGGDRDLISFLQRAVGYSLTGETDEKCLFFLYGPTDTGKTTLVETIREMLGDYAKGTEMQTFLYGKWGNSRIRNDIARLKKARFVSASEAGADQRFDQPILKLVTGSDKVVARYLYKEFFEFEPEFKIFLASNYRPKITGGDEALWNRIHVIPFKVRIRKEDQDKDLRKKFESEYPGILAWAVRGCLEWQRKGLQPPNSVFSAVKQYRSEFDLTWKFINDRCSIIEGEFTAFRELFDEWHSWCAKESIDAGTEKSFANALLNAGFEKDIRRVNGKQARGYKGIMLKSKLRLFFREKLDESLVEFDREIEKRLAEPEESYEEYLRQFAH